MADRKNLTKFEESLVQAMLTARSQREAYKMSLYKSDKMSDEHIDREASVILARPMVAQRLEELQGKVRQKAEEQALLSATDVLRKIQELIDRNEGKDDRTALNGLIAYGKHHKLFTEKQEVAITELPKIVVKRGKE